MRKSDFALAFAFFLATSVNAQQTNVFAGTWSGVMSTQAGDIPVTLVLTEAAGAWRMGAKGGMARRNPCLEKDMPVVVKSHSSTELAIAIEGATVLKGCIDATANLKSTDGKNLEGSLNDGRRVKLNRK